MKDTTKAHIVDVDKISDFTVGQTSTLIECLIKDAPRLGDLSVRSLACMSLGNEDPVGVYVFGDDSGKILYVGKTHGRSFHERMISHLDSREPVSGSPHLARLVSTQVKNNPEITRQEAVRKILDMRVLWIPIPTDGRDSSEHKEMIALAERRLLWKDSLDPVYNSERVKRNSKIGVAGKKRNLCSDSVFFSLED